MRFGNTVSGEAWRAGGILVLFVFVSSAIFGGIIVPLLKPEASNPHIALMATGSISVAFLLATFFVYLSQKIAKTENRQMLISFIPALVLAGVAGAFGYLDETHNPLQAAFAASWLAGTLSAFITLMIWLVIIAERKSSPCICWK